MVKTLSSLLLLLTVSLVHGVYDSSDDVIELTPKNFDSQVMNGPEIWVVEFYAPWCGHCQALVPEYKKLARALKGIIKVGAVDASEHQSLGGRFGVQGFPTIKMFGGNKNKPRDYQSERKAEAMMSQALSFAREVMNERMGGKSGGGGGRGGGRGGGSSGGGAPDDKDVIQLTDSNFEDKVLGSDEMWLVEFFAPWCGHCKNLAPEWAKAATQLKGKVHVAAVDATEHRVLASRFGIQGFPTIKFFNSGKKDWDGAEDYTGGRTADSIVAWAMGKWEKEQPPPEVYQLTSRTVMDSCTEKQLCFISFLPNILDSMASGRNGYLEIARSVGEQYKQRSFGWVWLEGGANSKLEEALEVGGFGYPALVAVNGRKGAYSALRGPYSYDGIRSFVRELIAMKSPIVTIRGGKLPAIEDSEPWDGQDGVLPVDDDDIDLSDVVLDDEPTKEEL